MCGVAGAIGVPDPYLTLIQLLGDGLKNRGENGAGVVLSDGKYDFFWERSEWDVPDLVRKISKPGFPKDDREYFCGIGHVRYGTTGERRSIVNTQPFVFKMPWGTLALCHNGDSPYAEEDRQKLLHEGTALSTSSDTELMLHYMALSANDNPIASIKEGLKKYRGTYSLVMLVRGCDGTKLVVARDPSGSRPLSLGRVSSGYVIASEDSSFEVIRASYERDIAPNELLIISQNGLESQSIYEENENRVSPCFCEYELGYFSRPHSKVFGVPVYAFREELGRRLGNRFGHLVKPGDILSYIPESANFYAKGFARSIHKELTDLLIRMHSDRSFIQENPQVVEDTLRRKFGFLRDKIKEILKRNSDAKLWLVDDSSVRGSTAKKMTKVFRELGFKWIGWLFGEPPLLGQCQKGIDMLSQGGSLIAPRHLKTGIMPDCAGIAAEIRSDFVGYLPLQDLYDTVELFGKKAGFNRKDFCFGCFENREPIWGKW